MEELESLTAAEQKEFAKWMKFHAVYKTLKDQMEDEGEDYKEEEKPGMKGSKMLMGGRS